MTALAEYLKSLGLWRRYILDLKAERESVEPALSAKNPIPGGPWRCRKDCCGAARNLEGLERDYRLPPTRRSFTNEANGPVTAVLAKASSSDLSDVGILASAWIKIADNIKNLHLGYTCLSDHGSKKRSNLSEIAPRGGVFIHLPGAETGPSSIPAQSSTDPERRFLQGL